MSEPSATKAAHDETLERLREFLVGVIDAAEGSTLIPIAVPRNAMDGLRECDRLEGIAKDFEDELDWLAESLREAGDELMARES